MGATSFPARKPTVNQGRLSPPEAAACEKSPGRGGVHPSGIAHPVNHHQPGKLKLWAGEVGGSTGQGWVAGPQLRSPLLKTLRPRSWIALDTLPSIT